MRAEAIRLRAALPGLGEEVQRLRSGVTELTARFPVSFGAGTKA